MRKEKPSGSTCTLNCSKKAKEDLPKRERHLRKLCLWLGCSLFAFFQLSSVSSFKLQAFMIFPRQRTIHANMSHIKLAC